MMMSMVGGILETAEQTGRSGIGGGGDVAAAERTRGRGDGAEKKAATGGKSRSGRGSSLGDV
jgi:hypothetical protein